MRRQGEPDSNGRCVVYWMQRAQRALDNPALDLAVEAANLLRSAGGHLLCSRTVLSARQLAALSRSSSKAFPTPPSRARKRGIGFALRRYPDHIAA